MTTEELIDYTRKAIELDDVKFNIISDNKHVHSWGVEVIVNNVIITLNAISKEDDMETRIKLSFKNDRFLNNGKVFNIPIKNQTIDYSVFEELTNLINKKMMRTEDDVANELKSMFRGNIINNILNEVCRYQGNLSFSTPWNFPLAEWAFKQCEGNGFFDTPEKKADIDAKAEIASQVNVTMKELADAYMSQTENDNSAEVFEKFQSLSREVVNTNLSDLRKVDEKKYFNGERYTVFVLYEINKKEMFKYMKKQAKTQKYVDKKTEKLIEDLIDQELSKIDNE